MGNFRSRRGHAWGGRSPPSAPGAAPDAGGYRVATAASPGMTSRDPAQRQPCPMVGPMKPDGLHGIFRTRRFEPAARRGPGQRHFQGRKHPPVHLDQQQQGVAHVLGPLYLPTPESGFAQTPSQVALHHGQGLPHDRGASHQNQASRTGDLMLVQAECLANQTPHSGADHRPTDASTRHQPQTDL